MRNLLVIALLIIVAAIFTNPSLEKHQAAVKEKVENMDEINADVDGDTLKKLGALLGDAIGLKTMEKYLNNNVKIEDLKVCSLTKMKINGEYKTVGIGAFGNVWLMGELKAN
jgi:hypothetical protein